MTSRNQPVVTLAEVPVSAPRKPRRVFRPAPGGVLPGPSSTDRATRDWSRSDPVALGEARRHGRPLTEQERMRPAPSLEHAQTGKPASGHCHTGTVLHLDETAGFLVADARGRILGKVEGPIYGASSGIPVALSIRSRLLRRRHCLVPADAIEAIDDRTRVIGLRIDRSAVRTFL